MTKYLSILLLCLIYSAQSVADKVALRLPPKSPEAQYIKEVLTLAYQHIDHQITWLDISGIRELELANKNQIDGALARAPAIEQEFPTLVKIPYPLLSFRLLKVSNRINCGFCLNQDISSVAYAKSSRISQQYVDQLPNTVATTSLSSPDKLITMLTKSRVDTILVMDFQLPKSAFNDANLIIETIGHELDYHYLAPQNSHLKQKLLNAFRALDNQGKLKSLQQKHQFKKPTLAQKPKSNRLIATTINFLSSTKANSNSNHWRILEQTLGNDFLISKQTNHWSKAITAFAQQKADILVGIPKNIAEITSIYSTFHTSYLPALVAFYRDDAKENSIKNYDKRMLFCSELSAALLGQVLPLKVEKVRLETHEKCVQLLADREVDSIIAYATNTSPLLKTLNKVTLNEKMPLFVGFQPTENGRYLKQAFDNKIKQQALNKKLRHAFASAEQYQQANIRPEDN